MSAILIKADQQSHKIISETAKKPGATVVTMSDSQYEDFLLGKLMDSEKTGEDVSSDEVMKNQQVLNFQQ